MKQRDIELLAEGFAPIIRQYVKKECALTFDAMCEAVGKNLGKARRDLREEVLFALNDLRGDLRLPELKALPKPRYRVPATTEPMSMGNAQYARAVAEKRVIRVPARRGASW